MRLVTRRLVTRRSLRLGAGLVSAVAIFGCVSGCVSGCKDEKKTDVNTGGASGDGSVIADAAAPDSATDAAGATDTDAAASATSAHGDAASGPTTIAGIASERGTKRHAADGGSGLETAGDTDGGAARARPKVVSADEGSDGKSIDLAPGQALVVSLNATPSSGFDWAVVKSPPALAAPDMSFVAGGDQMGAPGKRRLTFVLKSALPVGEHDLVLGYARSFEKGVAPFKTFKVKLHAPK